MASGNMFDMLRQAAGGKPGSSAGATVLFRDTAPSWQELEVLLSEQQAATGLPAQPDLVNGPPSAWSLKRLFGTTEEPKVHLYRDHAAWCPYCHRVWMQLEEKRIPYTITKINMRCYGDKPRDFLRKVPSGLLPVVEMNGRVYTESAEIMMMLEQAFPDHKPLLPPASDPARAEVRRLMTLERMFFSAWLQWLLGRWANEEAKRDFFMVVDQIEEALREVGGGGPFLLGKDISLVDLMIAPFLERASASLLYWKGFRMRGEGRWPALEAWFEAMEARPAYQASKSDYYTHCHDLPPQVGEPSPIAGAEKFMDFINGRDGSWDLPLKPLTGKSLEPEAIFADDGSQPVHRVRAAARLITNRDAVIGFALRGCGGPGPRTVSSPLCNPAATPDETHRPAVDAALRHVAHALLRGVESITTADEHAIVAMPAGSAKEGSAGGGAAAEAVYSGTAACQALAYMRDRICVPRDLPLTSARQLRAHANWFIDSVDPSVKHLQDLR